MGIGLTEEEAFDELVYADTDGEGLFFHSDRPQASRIQNVPIKWTEILHNQDKIHPNSFLTKLTFLISVLGDTSNKAKHLTLFINLRTIKM